MKSWFYHNVYCSHPADAVVNCGEEWDWACIRCEQMLFGVGPKTLITRLQNFIKRLEMVIFPLTDEEEDLKW